MKIFPKLIRKYDEIPCIFIETSYKIIEDDNFKPTLQCMYDKFKGLTGIEYRIKNLLNREDLVSYKQYTLIIEDFIDEFSEIPWISYYSIKN